MTDGLPGTPPPATASGLTERRPNPSLIWVLLAIAAILCLTVLLPWARELFRFGPLHLLDFAVALGAGIVVLVVLEVLKPLWRHRLVANGESA